MGHYYSPPRKTPEQECLEALEDFFTTKKRSDLLKAYEYTKRTDGGLISNLLGIQSKELIKEFPDCEIEYKADVTIAPPSKLFSKPRELTKMDLEKIHSIIEFDHDKVPYLKDTREPQISTGQNHFYSVKGVECFVLTYKKDKWNTKIKEFTNKYNFGIKGEEFITKRKESMSNTHLPDLINMVLDINKTQEIIYESFMEKTKADQFLLNIKTGRVYNLTLGLCKAKDRKDLLQLEIEYAGYVPTPGFNKKTNSEKELVQEILEIQKYIMQNYNNYEIDDFVLNIEPTTLTKFEWITGKISSSESKNEEKTSLVEDQTFFGDTF